MCLIKGIRLFEEFQNEVKNYQVIVEAFLEMLFASVAAFSLIYMTFHKNQVR